MRQWEGLPAKCAGHVKLCILAVAVVDVNGSSCCCKDWYSVTLHCRLQTLVTPHYTLLHRCQCCLRSEPQSACCHVRLRLRHPKVSHDFQSGRRPNNKVLGWLCRHQSMAMGPAGWQILLALEVVI
jgi:hypothetical protein